MQQLLNLLLSSKGGNAANQISQIFNIDQGTAELAIQKLLPALSRGVSNNNTQAGGLENLLALLGGPGENNQQLSQLGEKSSANLGNQILSMIFKDDKDVSRNVAGHAAKESGLDSGLLKKLLPVVALVLMNTLKNNKEESIQSAAASSAGNSSGGLLGLLDFDKDGSALDDVLNLAKRFF